MLKLAKAQSASLQCFLGGGYDYQGYPATTAIMQLRLHNGHHNCKALQGLLPCRHSFAATRLPDCNPTVSFLLSRGTLVPMLAQSGVRVANCAQRALRGEGRGAGGAGVTRLWHEHGRRGTKIDGSDDKDYT